jgi:hypothetical protein
LALHVAPAVAARITPEWIAALERRVGGAVVLRPEPGLAIWAGYVA